MKRSISVEINPTPRELEEALWNMDSAEQIWFLRCIADRYKSNRYRVLMQMQAIEDDLDSLTEERIDKNERKEIIEVLEQFLLYAKGDDICL